MIAHYFKTNYFGTQCMWFVFIISSETERITGILPQRYKFITHIKSSQRGMGI